MCTEDLVFAMDILTIVVMTGERKSVLDDIKKLNENVNHIDLTLFRDIKTRLCNSLIKLSKTNDGCEIHVFLHKQYTGKYNGYKVLALLKVLIKKIPDLADCKQKYFQHLFELEGIRSNKSKNQKLLFALGSTHCIEVAHG